MIIEEPIVPLDVNKKAIIRRLNHIISHHGEANEKNEFDFEQKIT